ncbi:hypothetical protein BK131_03565 [Paenibacillus amylolyticus]|uniref:Uncharacterized protein n=1 Tax=Paenibacillus amylolyticus TaxID=1451 RepID=A0A1R1C4K2_PAEAM|nr:hypothetical protein [Paenibacillus amylolyticus]OMF17062.1 hypothetical protein BK131_03565 [Paenibacillus amylolyticus]
MNSSFTATKEKSDSVVVDMKVYKADDFNRSNKKTSIQRQQNHYKSSNETAFTYENSNSNGGGGGMNDILRRLDDLERNQRELKQSLENLPSKSDLKNMSLELRLSIKDDIGSIPNEDRIKTIMAEQLSAKKIANETFVDSKINKARLTTVIWMVGIGVTIFVTVLTAILRKVIP